MIQDAVVRNLEIIGEAVKGLSETTRQAHPEIPWKAIAGIRDHVIHGYFKVSLKILADRGEGAADAAQPDRRPALHVSHTVVVALGITEDGTRVCLVRPAFPL